MADKDIDIQNKVQLFNDKKIRSEWDSEEEQWYFSVIDVIAVLTDSVNPRDYWFKMKKRVHSEDGIEGAVPKVWGSPNYFKFTSEFKSAKI